MSGFGKIKASPFIELDGGVDEYHDPSAIPNNKVQGNGKTSNVHLSGGILKVRPRKKRWGPSFENSFNGVREYIDPDGTSRVLVACNGIIYEVNESSKTARDTGLNPEDIHFNVHRGRVWYNGLNTQRKITRTTAARVGVVKPDNAPTVSKAGTGLTGSYAWKFTFCIKENSVVVWESDLSPISNSLSCTNEGATITPGASADTRVNARQIYRTSAGGEVFQYEGEIDNNTDGATFTSGSVTDANLGNIAETNHGVPAVGEISEGCNERMFWIRNDSTYGTRLYWSEMAHTEAYQEYQSSLNYKELPSGGKGTGLKRLYNRNTGREDLYIFQENGVSILQGGDPTSSLFIVSVKIGCTQHDSITEHGGFLVFVGNDAVYKVMEGRLIDISSRCFPKSFKLLRGTDKCRASVIFGHYYAFTCRSNLGKLYNHTAWVCDLSKIREVESGMADAVWYPWEIDAQYLTTLNDGTVLMLSDKDRRMYSLTESILSDQDENLADQTVTATFRTKSFGGESMNVRKCARQIFVKGKQQGELKVDVLYGYAYESSVDETTLEQAEGGAIFIVGTSTMGSPLSQFAIMMEGALPNQDAGNYFAFDFKKDRPDRYFEIAGIQFTYNSFQTGVR